MRADTDREAIAMTTQPKTAARAAARTRTPLLYEGMILRQPEFHRLYEKQPPGVRAELIGGVVFMASPQGQDHSCRLLKLAVALEAHETATPGVRVVPTTTTVLGPRTEPEPDISLRILPTHGGACRTSPRRYVIGAPELVVEISDVTLSRDLNLKKWEYAAAGVREYLVLDVVRGRLHRFDLARDRKLGPDKDGVFRSRAFPGLWIDEAAAAADSGRLLETLRRGLAEPGHAAFVRKLAKAAEATSARKTIRRQS
jgi:Uma2 family endonuclease